MVAVEEDEEDEHEDEERGEAETSGTISKTGIAHFTILLISIYYLGFIHICCSFLFFLFFLLFLFFFFFLYDCR